MRTSPSDPIRPGQLFPSRRELNDLLRQLHSIGASGGAGIRSGPLGTASTPWNPDYKFLEVLEADGEGWHAFQEIQFEQLADGTWTTGEQGITGTLTENPLYQLNGLELSIGQVVKAVLGPGNRCWVTSDAPSDVGSGGSGGGMTIQCADGSTYQVNINGNQITVSD